MPQIADFEPARRWLGQHPGSASSTCCCRTSWHPARQARHRGEARKRARHGPAAAGLDVRARRARRHGRRRPAWVSTTATPTASACRSPAPSCRCHGRATRSRRCRSRCTSTIGRPFAGDPRHVLAARARALHRAGPDAGGRGRARVLSRRPRAHGRRPPQPPRQPLAGRREYRTQINSMADLDEYTAVLQRDRRRGARTGGAVRHRARRIRPGQFEVNLHHRDALAACDHAIRLKRLDQGRRAPARHGRDVHGQSPIATGRQRRAPAREPARYAGPQYLCRRGPARQRRRCTHAIGGLAATLDGLMALFAPPANSYRRFQPEAYVPLNASWAVNNRGVALRVPHSDAGQPARGASRRRCRRESVSARGGGARRHHLGLEQRLDPGPPLAGNAYRDHDARRSR